MLLQTYENEGSFYQCDPIPLMELGTVAHKYFLINLRLPVNDTINVGIGEIKDIHMVVSLILLYIFDWSEFQSLQPSQSYI